VDFAETVLLSSVMGLSIYLSLPIVLHKNTGERRTKILTSVAIGILIFLMGDVFSNAAASLYNGSLYGFGSSPFNDLVFMIALGAGFLVLFLAESRSKAGLTQTELALVIAIGMGFQNLTEGLVFGSLGAAIGLSGAALVVLVGFILQNISEGFPIASPFLGKTEGKAGLIALLFAVGSVPTVIGSAVGFFYHSAVFDLAFDGIAIGAILYAILPMLKALLRESSPSLQRLSYLGVFVGFLLGFLVNLV
jgi:zinc transporter, ZIP family